MRALLVLGLILCLSVLAGCATMTQSPAEVRNTYRRSCEYDTLQLSEDWNHMWLLDRPSRLTRWVTR